MADDFPSAASLYTSSRTRSSTGSKAKKGRGRKKARGTSTASDRRVLAEAADTIAGDEEESPKRGKSAIDKIADKVTADLFKQTKGRRKPSAAQRRANADKASDLAATLMGIGNTPVGQLAKKGGALAIGSTAALALLAGVGSYYATTYIIDRLAAAREARTPQAVRFEAAMAYRQSRVEAERKLGRSLSSSEHDYLAKQFKQKLATIGG